MNWSVLHTARCVEWCAAFGVAECVCPRIEVTALQHPPNAAVVAYYCKQCKATVFLANCYVPLRQNAYWRTEMCAEYPLHGTEWKYNTRLLPKFELTIL